MHRIDPSLVISRRHALRLLAGVGLVPMLPRLWPSHSGWSARPANAETQWASGGTAAMVDKASYPNPFESGPDSCLLIASTTAGPCTTAIDLLRQDISEGWTGLPVRLGIRVVDSGCNPLPNVSVKVWHTNIEGSYSGQTPNNNMCLKTQSYATADFFRGVQTTDDNGIVFFDTCFPGWYRGRAVHIHFQVKNGTQSYRVSQLFFPEDVTEDIFADHPEYSPYGQPDTTLSSDNIVSGISSAERERHIVTVARMTDGAMLAAKDVTVIQGVAASTPTPIAGTPTATATNVVAEVCTGDCDEDGSITVDEIVKGINIALGDGELASCSPFDSDGGGAVTVDEILAAVTAALNGCS